MTTNRGKKFTINSFWNTLSNPKYIGECYVDGIKLHYPPIINTATFERVQKQLALKRQSPASGKAKEEYILHGKAYCGHCGSKLIGVSGTSKLGIKHCYYVCSKQYKYKTCNKRYEKKNYLEQYVIEQTLKYVLRAEESDKIADSVLEMYGNSITAKRIKEYERTIARIESEFDKCTAMLLQVYSVELLKRLDQKAKDLELQKADNQKELTKLKLANSISHTKEDILQWIELFAKGDIKDFEYRRRIIKIFVNAIFIFDDKLVLYYNVINNDDPVEHEKMLEDVADYEGQAIDNTNTDWISCVNVYQKTANFSGFFAVLSAFLKL